MEIKRAKRKNDEQVGKVININNKKKMHFRNGKHFLK